MNMVFLHHLDTCVVIYLYGLLFLNKMVKEYQKALDTVFARLAKH